jgi:hypothetical protein
MVTKPAKKKPAPKHKRTTASKKPGTSIWERIVALGESIPAEERARAPRDGARNLHHYLHGAPKQDPD